MALHDFIKTQFKYAKKYSVKNKKAYLKIIYLDKDNGTVFKAAQARLYGFTKSNPKSVTIYEWLAGELYNYINSSTHETKKSFDEWHDRTCRNFVGQCKSLGIKGSRTGPVCYGMAQKFVNISLKYIYCFEDATSVDEYDKFTFGHVALDSYTYCR